MNVFDAMSSNNNQDVEKSLLEWFKACGGQLYPAVGLAQFPGMGRGAIALADIEPDTLLFSIPRNILINTTTSDLPKVIEPEDWAALQGWTPLILTMMYEYLKSNSTVGEEKSRWRPYFNAMPAPSSFDSLMFWTEKELEYLAGSLVVTKIGKEEAEEEYNKKLIPVVEKYDQIFGDRERYTLQLFHYMGTLILSRSFHVESGVGKAKQNEEEDSEEEDEEEELENVEDVSMVPMADILNAKSGFDNARLFYEPQTLNMMSTKQIKAGEQIYNTYADPPNSDLLRRYGHVDEENPADIVEISLETIANVVDSNTELSEVEKEARAHWLLEVGVDDTYSIDQSLDLPEEMISAIRTFMLSQNEIEKRMKKESPPQPKLNAEVVSQLRKVLEARIQEYETAVPTEQLTKELETDKTTYRRNMAKKVVSGELKILTSLLEDLDSEWPIESLNGASEGSDKTRKRVQENSNVNGTAKKSKR